MHRKLLKEYQGLIGKLLIAIAIVVVGLLIAGAISSAGSNIFSAPSSLGTLVRDGLS